MRVGGLFPVTKEDKLPAAGLTCPADDSRWMMSGRCGILLALEDWLASDPQGRTRTNPRVYLPAYTCETVVASFLKLGLNIEYYLIDTDLKPHFESDKLFNSDLCLFTAYYGRETYREAYLDGKQITSFDSLLKTLQAKEICIFFDLTHSLLNTEPLPEIWDYAAGSFRKWMGIYSGGFALKHQGCFMPEVLPANEKHIALRKQALNLASALASASSQADIAKLRDLCDAAFWQGEMMLRQCFDIYASDLESLEILKACDFERMRSVRRDNYHFLADKVSQMLEKYNQAGVQIVFPTMQATECPSHFTLLVEDREAFTKKMDDWQIKTSVYWPILDGLQGDLRKQTEKITEHIISLPCDQRYDRQAMIWLLCAIAEYLEENH